MAKNTETTTKFKVDISELKSSLQDANRQIALTNSEFKAATAGMDNWSSSADGLSAKITQLKNVNQNYSKILDEVQNKYNDVVRTEGENSESAQNLQIKMNSLKAAIKGNEAAISKYEKSLDELERGSDSSANGTDELGDALEDAGDSAKKAEKELDGANKKIKETGDNSDESSGKLKGFLGALGKGAIAGLGAAITGLAGGLVAATESSKEFNDNMAKLSSAAKDGGYSADFAEKSFQNMYGVLGDETAANTTVSNFMAMGTSTENLNSLLNSSAGIWAKYGDSIPLDGLAESVNETAKVGQITGNLADALNWAGENEDDFNAKLAACSDEQQRQQLIVDTLNGLYGDLGKEYKKNNKAMIDLNTAQLSMKQSIADIGTAFTPVLAMFTQFGAGILADIVPDVENLASAFTDLVNGVDGAGEKIGSSVGNIITSLVTTITNILPTVATVGVEIIQSIIGGITESSGEILSAASEIIMTLANGIVMIAPQLLTSIITIVAQIIQEIITLAPQLLSAAMQLFQGLITALTEIDLGTTLSNLITSLVTMLTQSTPELFAGATTLFNAIVQAVPELLNQLLPVLPTIIDSITNFLVTALPDILAAAQTMLNGLIDALPLVIQALTTSLPDIIHSIANFLVQSVPQILDAAIQLFNALVEALPQIIQSLVAALPTIISAIVQFLMDAVPQLLSAALNFLGAIVRAIPTIAQDLIVAVPQILNAIIEGLAPLAEKIGEKLTEAWNKFTEWCGEMIIQAGIAMLEFINTIDSWLSDLPGKVWEWLSNVISNVASWAADMGAKASQAASDFFNNIANRIQELPGEFWNWLSNIISNVTTFASNLGSKASEAARNLWDNLVDGISGLPDEIYNIGSNIVEGLWNGIGDMAGWIYDKISGFGEGVLDTLKGFFGIASPSKVMRDQIGQFLPMGIAEGIEDKTKSAVNAMKKSAKKTLDAAKGAVANVSNDLNIGTNGIANGNTKIVNTYNFNQTNNSPKALSRYDIYRQSKNLLSAKGV